MKDKHLQYTIQYNQIMIHHLLHLVILLIVLLIIHLDKDLPQSAIPPILTINTLHTNPITNVTTSRTLSRPPIPLIQNNPLSYNLTSTNTQFSSNNTQSNLNIQPSSTHFQTIPTTIYKHFNPYKQFQFNLKSMF